MGNKKKPSNVFHYGMPLYGAAWPAGDRLFVCGGGGQSASGIKNRCVFADFRRGALSDQTGEINFGSNCPTKMAATPDGRTLLFAMDAGGLRRFNVSHEAPAGGAAGAVALVESPITPAKRVAEIEQHIKCLSFSGDASSLALGCDNGSLLVLRWPSMRLLAADDSVRAAVRDVDWAPAYGNELLAVAREDGNCALWDVASGEVLARLHLPRSLHGCSVDRCRWARDGRRSLFALLNHRSRGCFVAEWEDPEGTATLRFVRKTRVSGDPGTAMEVHPKGCHLAVGTSEGDLFVLDSRSLRVRQRAKKVHMVFITAVAFAADGHAVMSVGADGRAHAMRIRAPAAPPAPAGLGRALVRMLLLVLLFGTALVVLALVAAEPCELKAAAERLAAFAERPADFVAVLQQLDAQSAAAGVQQALGHVTQLARRLDAQRLLNALRRVNLNSIADALQRASGRPS